MTITIPITAAQVASLLAAKAGDSIILSAPAGAPVSGVTLANSIPVALQSAADIVKTVVTTVVHHRDGSTSTSTTEK
jgi:hypothetical protein